MKTTILLTIVAFAAVQAQPDVAIYLERAAATPVAPTPANSPQPQLFQLRGGGTTSAQIVDSQNRSVLRASPEQTIIECAISPSGNQILVYYGNSDYAVYEPKSDQQIALPSRPPGDGKTAFSAWHWIDDDLILGEAGDELGPKQEMPGEDTMAIRSRLYIYNLERRTLANVRLPEDISTTNFVVMMVRPDGYVHLQSAANDNDPKDLGWFKLPSK